MIIGGHYMKVKSAVLNELKDEYVIEEVELRDLKPNEVRVKLVASGICQSDEGIRVGKSAHEFPAILGHEGAGIIEEVGAGVTEYEVGDHVVMAYNYCDQCDACLTGQPTACEKFVTLNTGGGPDEDGQYKFEKEDGTEVSDMFNQSSFSVNTVTAENNLTKVDKDVDLRLVGPLGCGFQTGFGTVVDGLKPHTNSSIAVFGIGTVGLAAIMAAKLEGQNPIIAVDLHDSRLDLAKELGATHTINSKDEDVEAIIDELTNGKGLDFSIDTTGVTEVVETSIRTLGINGVAAPIAISDKEITLEPTSDLTMVARTVKGVRMGNTVPQITIPKMISLYKEGKFPFDKLVKYYKFEDINKASEDSNNGSTIKPILIIDEDYRSDEPIELEK